MDRALNPLVKYFGPDVMCAFRGARAHCSKEFGNCFLYFFYNWADNALVLPFNSMSVYTLNKMIARPECASKRLRELLPEITSMFSMETRRDS
jgi:hypothetical protein